MSFAEILNRMVLAPLTLAGVAIIVFILLRVVPGDPIAMMISPGAGPPDIAALRAHYGLDQPLPNQFWIWVKHAITGDFGTSISLHVDVLQVLLSRLPATLELAVTALVIAVFAGGMTAIAGTAFRRTALETTIDGLNSIFLAVPDFIWALAFVLLFAVALPILPLTGRIDPAAATGFTTHFYLAECLVTGRFGTAANVLSHMTLPALALALPLAAVIVRLLKQSLKEAMAQDYVLLARIKGFGELHLIVQEALRNAIGPTLALCGVQFTFLIGGTVIVERIFAYPGLGNLAIDAVINRDYPLIQGLVLVFGLIFILINMAVDLSAAALNPKLRHGQW
jgi:ABC-type dipeptide/oligopeptide/nickel transport system permease component